MKLILVRHGETDWVNEGKYQGATDVSLNERGFKQAKKVALAIKKEKPFAIYCSKLKRVRQTAKSIATTCRKKLAVDARLNEISFGVWEGFSFREIKGWYPEAVYNWYHTTWASHPTGGESLESLKKRISLFMRELKKKYKGRQGGTCVLVTHGGPIRMILLELLKIPVSLFWTIRVDPASISVVNITEKYEELTLLNSQAHLNGCQTTFEYKQKNK
jgi:alpha-ribazole phosphatase